MKLLWTIKKEIGALIYDLPRFYWTVRPSGSLNEKSHPWVFMHNRNERLICDDRHIGAVCNWQWTSDLHIAKVFPSLGLRLMRRAFNDWPIELHNAPVPELNEIGVSFIIGHRGIERLPHLLTTIGSIAAQRDISAECIVVEQSETPEIKDALPEWVTYIHTPLPDPAMPYCRSWAFNVGARAAKGKLLVFHDNDILVPQDYASQLLARSKEGYEVINLKRFIFFLTERHSVDIISSHVLVMDESPDTVMQNAEGGGSIAITRDSYFEIGGFDESFIGWGGEDNEFWERAQTRKVWPYGYLPFAHLWHQHQTEKSDLSRRTAALYEERSKIARSFRIQELRARSFGDPLRLSG